jgi:hypothetical protein
MARDLTVVVLRRLERRRLRVLGHGEGSHIVVGANLPKVDPTRITKMADIRMPMRPSYVLFPEHSTASSGDISGPASWRSTSRASSIVAVSMLAK